MPALRDDLRMLYMQQRRLRQPKIETDALDAICDGLKDRLQPMLRRAVEVQAALLGLARTEVDSGVGIRAFPLGPKIMRTAEVLISGREAYVFSLYEYEHPHDAGNSEFILDLFAIGSNPDFEHLEFVEAAVSAHFSKPMSPFIYSTDKFDKIKDDAREQEENFSALDLPAAKVLTGKQARALAVAIKASLGGLMVSALGKQLSGESPERVEQLQHELMAAGIIESEIVIVCKRTSNQVARVPDLSAISAMTTAGVRCSCGRPINEERHEQALAITDLGRELLNKSRWMSTIVVDELIRFGVPSHRILLEATVGGDEIDVVADISGDIALFELKDKEFNLREAYSFGAKMGIIVPKHAVVITSEYVGGDAKEHFSRAQQAQNSSRLFDWERDGKQSLTYIEGVDDIRLGIERLVASIRRRQAEAALTDVLPFAAIRPGSVFGAIDSEELASRISEAPIGA